MEHFSFQSKVFFHHQSQMKQLGLISRKKKGIEKTDISAARKIMKAAENTVVIFLIVDLTGKKSHKDISGQKDIHSQSYF